MTTGTSTNNVKGVLNLGFGNSALYRECNIHRVGPQKFQLRTPPPQLIPQLRENLKRTLAIMAEETSEVTLTGRAPVWAYALAGAVAAEHFEIIWYYDGQQTMSIV